LRIIGLIRGALDDLHLIIWQWPKAGCEKSENVDRHLAFLDFANASPVGLDSGEAEQGAVFVGGGPDVSLPWSLQIPRTM
jgi:hypothetical protein